MTLAPWWRSSFVKWWARFERLVASPSAYEELGRIITNVDVRDVLPANLYRVVS
jgi:hypothetical protein